MHRVLLTILLCRGKTEPTSADPGPRETAAWRLSALPTKERSSLAPAVPDGRIAPVSQRPKVCRRPPALSKLAPGSGDGVWTRAVARVEAAAVLAVRRRFFGPLVDSSQRAARVSPSRPCAAGMPYQACPARRRLIYKLPSRVLRTACSAVSDPWLLALALTAGIKGAAWRAPLGDPCAARLGLPLRCFAPSRLVTQRRRQGRKAERAKEAEIR